jgi:TPR repeat protein
MLAETIGDEFAKDDAKAAEQGHIDAQRALERIKQSQESQAHTADPQPTEPNDSTTGQSVPIGAVLQYELGIKYENGNGVEQDLDKAFDCYLSAAEQGHAEAQFFLAVIYATGRGVTKDMAKSAEWFHKAAENGQITAQETLGGMYEVGVVGVKRDYVKAAEWYSRAAARGSDIAQEGIKRLLVKR